MGPAPRHHRGHSSPMGPAMAAAIPWPYRAAARSIRRASAELGTLPSTALSQVITINQSNVSSTIQVIGLWAWGGRNCPRRPNGPPRWLSFPQPAILNAGSGLCGNIDSSLLLAAPLSGGTQVAPEQPPSARAGPLGPPHHPPRHPTAPRRQAKRTWTWAPHGRRREPAARRDAQATSMRAQWRTAPPSLRRPLKTPPPPESRRQCSH